MSKLNVLIAGSTGYIGIQLIKLLIKHPNIKIKYLCGNTSEGKLISYFDKKQYLEELKMEEAIIINEIKDLDFKNSLLSNNLDLDYIETLIRERLLFGKENEKIYIIKNDTKN